jgi:hypothetical protein
MSLHFENTETAMVATCLVPDCDQDFHGLAPVDVFGAWYVHLCRDHPDLQR